jgi:hypothetical protein
VCTSRSVPIFKFDHTRYFAGQSPLPEIPVQRAVK